ncbi:MAG: DEAD/DEAH box helicase [Thermoprotei archaeon]|nr:MAG: DEAD/DEAH box helicase [Thermoprotei archaeon]
MPPEYINLLRERGITELNPVQKLAVSKGVLRGKNLVVSTPTASGKTLIGELALVKSTYSGGIGVYLVPLRALASEKYAEFKVLEKLGLSIGISTGDFESPAEHLGAFDLVIATYERFDSILRLKPRWLNKIKCVVIDELHNINDPDRGPIVEMIIARLLSRNIQLVGLSATIGNPHILAKWMKAELVDLPWRPVKLIEGFYDKARGTIVFKDGRTDKITYRIGSSALNIAVQSVLNNVQVLVFIHNRRRTEEYAERVVEYLGLYKHLVNRDKVSLLLEELRNSPSRIEREKLGKLIVHGVAYHHAGLSSIARRVVERGFRDRVIRVVFATPTLAAGVNLPAKRVLVSIKRYDPGSGRYRNIPVFEYKQMAGRAGRPQYDQVGEAIIYDAQSSREAWKYINGFPEPVSSKLGSERSLRIYVLALIASHDAYSVESLIKIFKNTLYYEVMRDTSFLRNNIHRVILELVEWGMLKTGRGELHVTDLGRITAITYLDPLSVHRYLYNVPSKPGILYYLHKIAYTPDYTKSRPYISDRVLEEYEDEALILAEEGVIPGPPSSDAYEYYQWLQSYVHARMLHDWINEVNEDTIIERYGIGPGDIYSARDTAAWIAGALSHVERVLGNSDRALDLEKLSIRLEHGIKEDALELVKLEGVGRIRARVLISHGIKNLEDLAHTPIHVLEKLPGFGSKLARSIKEQLRELGYI